MKKFFFLVNFLLLLGAGSLPAQWTQLGEDIDGEMAGDQSGWSVSLSADGTRVAIGALLNDGNGDRSGHVRVYEESAGVWSQLGSDIDGEAAIDISGYSVSLSADGARLAIGAIRNDGTAFNAGHVRVYEESAGVWTQLGVDIDAEAGGDRFGYSVSLSSGGSRLAVGATFNDGNGNSAGHVRIYEESAGVWSQVGHDIDGEANLDEFGFSVSLSADGIRLAIGAIANDGNGSNAGHVRVYEEIAGVWSQMGEDIEGAGPGDLFGYSVSLSANGERLAIGAPFNDGNGDRSGHVRVYEESAGDWSQLGGDLEGEVAGDQSGRSVSLSAGGDRLAIGAIFNNGSFNHAGHVRVYQESAGDWSQLGDDINGEVAGEQSGWSVSLSAGGDRLAIGARFNSDNGASAGHTRVYEGTFCPDADMDGFTNSGCGGTDCDDDDASVNPNATEVCNGIDDDCDGLIDEDGVCCEDPDGDEVCVEEDNCPNDANPGQEDTDCDGVGNACDICPGGDDSMDYNGDNIPDCSQLLDYNDYSPDWHCGNNKISVCHSDNNLRTICINENALSTHYDHGDMIGPCTSCPQNLIVPGNNSIPIAIGMAERAEHQEIDASGLTIFPNPAGKEVTFHLYGFGDEAAELTLIDVSGKAVWQKTIEEGQHVLTLDLSGNVFASGLYFVKISSSGTVLTERLVISK